jgi:uncharacterized tellurite resistance protein B-like protein
MSWGMDDARAQVKDKLGALIERVMADGKIEPAEREELQSVYRQALLTVADVKDVLGRYMRAVQDEVLADGRVTEEERARCRAVVSELKIPPSLWSTELKAIIAP